MRRDGCRTERSGEAGFHPAMKSTAHTQDHAQADRGRSASTPAQIPASGWKDVAVRTWKESSKDNVGLVAAGIAFYGFLALVPLLGAMILTYGIIADPQAVIRHA